MRTRIGCPLHQYHQLTIVDTEKSADLLQSGVDVTYRSRVESAHLAHLRQDSGGRRIRVE